MRFVRSGCVAVVVASVACRKDAAPVPASDAGVAPSVTAPGEPLAQREPVVVDGGRAGVCEGASLALFAALTDPRCAASGREWSAALDAGKGLLRQEATRDGDRLEFTLVNAGMSPIVVPLRYRPGRVNLPAFSVLADDGHRGLYELAPPTLEDAPVEASPADASLERVHTARLTLGPRGAARARLRVDPAVSRRLSPPCPDASPVCGEGRLAPGRYVLHVGLLLAGIDAGDPARVDWDLPP